MGELTNDYVDGIELAVQAEAAQESQWRRRLQAAALAVGAAAALTACESSPPNGPAPNPPVAGQPGQGLPDLSVRHVTVWDKNNCLADYVAVNNQQVFGRQTNLCRYRDTQAAGADFYVYYPRGNASQWIMESAYDNAGNFYWRYPNGAERERQAGTNQVFVRVNGQFIPEHLTPQQMAVEGVFETAATQRMVDLEAQTYIAPPPNTVPTPAQQKLAQVQQAYAAEQQKNQQLQAELQARQQSQDASNAALVAQERAFMDETMARAREAFVRPDCDGSFNGCF